MRQTHSDALPKADPRWRIGIVHSSYYKEDVSKLVDGAVATLKEAGVAAENIQLHPVPGCFEIPLIGSALAEAKKVDGLLGLGIIVEGETHHARLVAQDAARGMMDVQVRYQTPFAFEVLYVKDLKDAQVRSSGPANKGREAARAVLLSLAEKAKISS